MDETETFLRKSQDILAPEWDSSLSVNILKSAVNNNDDDDNNNNNNIYNNNNDDDDDNNNDYDYDDDNNNNDNERISRASFYVKHAQLR